MFFIREIRYLYYYHYDNKICSAGTLKCHIRGKTVTLEFHLKNLSLAYPVSVKLNAGVSNTEKCPKRYLELKEHDTIHKIVFEADREFEAGMPFYVWLSFGDHKIICDENTRMEYANQLWNGKDEGVTNTIQEKKTEEPDRIDEQEEEEERNRINEREEAEERNRIDEWEEAEERNRIEKREETEEQDRIEERNRINEREEAEERNRINEQEETEERNRIDKREKTEETDEETDPVAQQKKIVHIPDLNGQLQQFYVLKPEELKYFGKAFEEFTDNTFLLHGYYNYRHILVGPIQNDGVFGMQIGVPGNSYKREEVVAAMFGFPGFAPVKGRKETGAFGYFFTG